MNSSLNDDERPSESSAVLDSSALLAYALNEDGADEVLAALSRGAAISAVNLAETLTKLVELGAMIEDAIALVLALNPIVVPFDQHHSEVCASLRQATRRQELSLGDRACLALARTLGVPAVTADRNWARVEVGVPVTLIR